MTMAIFFSIIAKNNITLIVTLHIICITLLSLKGEIIEFFFYLMHILTTRLTTDEMCSVVILCGVPKFFNLACAARALYTMRFTYMSTSRSTSRRDFPRVIRLRNGSVSRYGDIRDDWPITARYRYKKLTLIGIQNRPKLTREETRFARHACHPRYCDSF